MKQISFLILVLLTTTFYGQSDSKLVNKTPIQQLRIYEIPTENVQVFHYRFRDHALRIMKKYNFKIVAIWESSFETKTEFVYLLEWENEKLMKAAWDNFMADNEWKEIKAETAKIHGRFVNKIEDRTLILTDYSPQRSLLDLKEEQ